MIYEMILLFTVASSKRNEAKMRTEPTQHTHHTVPSTQTKRITMRTSSLFLLLCLRPGVGFVVRLSLINLDRQRTFIHPAVSSSSSENHPPGDLQHPPPSSSILEDSAGHINRELAERIWTWEQDHRKSQNLPKLNYSVRSGLRLVDQTARDMMMITENNNYNDLVQEGLSALLDAMSHYQGDDDQGFEKYARKHIHNSLLAMTNNDAALRLPKRIRSTIRRAKLCARDMQLEGETPTLTAVAEKLDLEVERLADYMRLAQTSVSVESTVEILLTPEERVMYRDQEEWELTQGLLLDDGRQVNMEQLVEDYLDESTSREGDDDAWIQEQEIAGPLQDMIPDRSNDDDEHTLTDMIRYDMRRFLSSVLDPEELKVVRCTFGLDGEPMKRNAMAAELGVSPEKVSELLTVAIEKLRDAYQNQYISSYDQDHEDSA